MLSGAIETISKGVRANLIGFLLVKDVIIRASKGIMTTRD